MLTTEITFDDGYTNCEAIWLDGKPIGCIWMTGEGSTLEFQAISVSGRMAMFSFQKTARAWVFAESKSVKTWKLEPGTQEEMMRGNWPTIDHGLLRRSGRMIKLSRPGFLFKRLRAAALEREWLRFFDGGDDLRHHTKTTRQESLRRQAAELRTLAAGGIKPRAFPKMAAAMEAEADRLDALARTHTKPSSNPEETGNDN